MNTPNKLTLVRIILIIPITALILESFRLGWWCWLVSGLLFGAASITDALDGSIARRHGLVTDFGKLMDPVADKLLVTAVFTCFVSLGLCPPWVLIAILAREFLITSIRMVSASRGNVIPANIWGKVKTVTQMAAIIITICFQLALSLLTQLGMMPPALPGVLGFVQSAALWAAAAATIVSGAVYVYQSRELFLDA